MKRKILLILLMIGTWVHLRGYAVASECGEETFVFSQEKRVTEWRKERDDFLKDHPRSPFSPQTKKSFKSLKYYPFSPRYIFCGPLERYILNINNPNYYTTFLTNKGTGKRYVHYGKFHFRLDGKEYVLEIYKSILSDTLFIPFKDRTNGRETYRGGRYVDAEILPKYKIVLDFNMAYSPSCAYNDKFVCALAPQENTLDIEIPAGERNFK